MTASAKFERAFRLHQQGKLREAFLRYDAIVQADPTHAAALHFSGVVLHQAGQACGSDCADPRIDRDRSRFARCVGNLAL